MDFSRLEDFIFEKMSKTHLPGLSIAIVKDGEVIYTRGFCFRDVEYSLRATPNTLYGIGSITKSFTALSIMQLAEKGKLSLEDSVSKYVP
ncbi:MAG: serine hydrolase domain-containing protein, partial [Candidatus Bathyarchaeota archaeon]|nr:serine hydrolase domain-containing protein [Candidatus Bathyarchaeota archaeon]